jgi:hypothetical protein
LLGTALGAGGFLHSLRVQRAHSDDAREAGREEIAELQRRVDLLERENQSLRSLAQGGGEVQVPAEWIEFVEAGVGLDFRSSPVVHRIAGEELLGRVTASIESRFPPNTLDHRQAAWSRMGLLTPDDRFANQLAATYALGARSWFDDQTGEAWVPDDFDPASVPDQASVIRSLSRILLHQHFPPLPGYPGDDAERARTALHHGTAIHIENRYLARQALGIGFTGTQDPGGAMDLLNNLPAFIRGLATFPSQTGTTHASRLVESGTLLEALHDPPRSTAEIANLETGPAPPRPESESAVLVESAGWLGLRLWLATIDPDHAGLADSWRGDQYRLTARSETRLDLVWDLELADADAAAKVAEVGRAMAGLLADTAEDPPLGDWADSPAGGRIRVSLPGPSRVRFEHLAAP